ncbi:MAG: formylglycine-generating enzyme family protein [Leptolyngbyaceae cyanobacterium RM2_2_21]|nr:formylglycine-generating enzyme family protein [Leptolyngbyaceae cyanobacterium RM2_2_21]
MTRVNWRNYLVNWRPTGLRFKLLGAFPAWISLTGLFWVGALLSCAAPLADETLRDRCEAQPGFAFVAAGSFISGSDEAERSYGYEISAAAIASAPADRPAAEQGLRQRGWFDSEPERQTTEQAAFCMSQQLTTNADYQAFVKATGHRAPGISADDYQTQGFLVHPYSEVQPYLWQGSDYPPGEGQYPVVLVSYDDAIAYADWKGQQTGQIYRLPTALEWEKAARGEDGRYFPWGSDWQPEATNWAGQAQHTTPVGNYPLSRSPYGIEDMAGNVFEFTNAVGDRQRVVMKGCSWDDLPGFCRAAYRHSRPVGSRHILFGFRLVIDKI